MIQAVFFDLYETLITEWENGEKKAAYSTDMLGIEQSEFRKQWQKQKALQSIGQIPDFRSALEQILIELDMEVDHELLEFLQEERTAGKSLCFSNIDRDIFRMLDELKSTGLKLGLISNCTVEDVKAWESCELASYFDDVIFSYEAGVAKPDLEIYQMGCDRLNVDPNQCVFIGDGGSDELSGAMNAGMTAYQAAWFLRPYKTEFINHDLVLDKPIEVFDTIVQKNKA